MRPQFIADFGSLILLGSNEIIIRILFLHCLKITWDDALDPTYSLSFLNANSVAAREYCITRLISQIPYFIRYLRKISLIKKFQKYARLDQFAEIVKFDNYFDSFSNSFTSLITEHLNTFSANATHI